MDGLIWQFSLTNAAFTVFTVTVVVQTAMARVRKQVANSLRELSTRAIEQRMADEVRMDQMDHRMVAMEHQMAELRVLLDEMDRRYRRLARQMGLVRTP